MRTKDFSSLGKGLVRSCCPDLFVKRELILFLPIAPILRGFCFDNSGSDASAFYFWAMFIPLCIPTKHIHFTFGHRLGQHKRWRIGDHDLQNALCSEMKKEMPFLQGLSDLGTLATTLEVRAQPNANNYINPLTLEALAYVLLLKGDPEASNVLRRIVRYERSSVAWEAELGKRASLIARKLARGTSDAISQLRDWEQESLSNLHFQ